MLAAAGLADLHAQSGPTLNVLDSCNSGRSKVKITRCPTGAGASCDVQFDQLLGTLRSCTKSDGRPALRGPQAPAKGVAPSVGKTAASSGPVRIGDTVEVYSLFGWVQVQIVAMQGSAMKVCCVDGQQLNVDLRNLRKAHGSTASARFTPDPKPDFGCAGKIDGTDSDDVGVLPSRSRRPERQK
jgi:hypothetical protein